jgi:hypothetical protein
MIEDEEIKNIEKRMTECVAAMRKMTALVGVARQVKEFSSDQRKNVLAAEQIKYIRAGESVAAAENLARSSPTYLAMFKSLEKTYADACGTIAEWEAVFARFEACRSMLSMARATLGL